MDPVPDPLVDPKGGVRVSRVVDGDAGESKGKVVLAVPIEEGRRGVEGGPGGAAGAEGRDGVVGFVDGRAGEDGVGCVLEGRGREVAAGFV